MNSQYDLELFEKDVQDYYIDQAGRYSQVYDCRISSCYTPHGIKCIDSQYSILIKNILVDVKQVYRRDRIFETYSDVKTHREHESSIRCHTWYIPIELEGADKVGEVLVEWVNGQSFEFFYSEKPKFNPKTNKIDVDWLRESITNNSHLHVMIKENLLGNLDTYLNE